MGVFPTPTEKLAQKEPDEALRREINHKFMEECAASISKFVECETDGKFSLFPKCGKQRKELEDCCVRFAEKMRKTSAAAKQPGEK